MLSTKRNLTSSITKLLYATFVDMHSHGKPSQFLEAQEQLRMEKSDASLKTMHVKEMC